MASLYLGRALNQQRVYDTSALATFVTASGAQGFWVEDLSFSDLRLRINQLRVDNQSTKANFWLFWNARRGQANPDYAVAPGKSPIIAVPGLPRIACYIQAIVPSTGIITVYFSSRESTS